MKVILVVDDEYAIVEALEALLSDEGWAVATANNGADALIKVRELLPALCLVDVMMPVMGGRELVERVRADASIAHVPVVLMSAAAQVSAHELGAQGFLRKPFSLDALLHVIEKLVGKPGS